MAKKRSGSRPAHKIPARRPEPRQSVVREAWENMNRDFDRLLPERLRKRDKKPFVLWLFLLELVVLGVAGTFLYDWLTG
ncbi:MAG: hypothetical protein RQ723_07390 [Desulfuromonadales bacterium]|nr:hypothetical protein [Desulfuromonadales bacterium]